MPMPSGLKAIDLMMDIPDGDPSAWYEFIKPLLLDEESRNLFTMPAQYRAPAARGMATTL